MSDAIFGSIETGHVMDPSQPNEFERAATQGEQGIISEFLAFLAHNKKWWLLPLLIVLLLLGLLIFLSTTAVAPFIYTLF